jgi:type IV secretion system protein VirB9
VRTPLVILATVVLCGSAQAQIRPQPGGGDPRFQSVEYQPEQVVQLQAAPGYQLSVEFAPDERIESVAVGDSGAWQITPNRRGDHLFIKTTGLALPTNMTVVTDARTYLFDLHPLDSASPDMAYTVRFTYPRPEGIGESASPVADAVSASYRVSGERTLRPTAISDDGVHTYLEWPANAAIPAIYMIDERGRETLVNGMMRDGLFVIDAVAPRLMFRIDRRYARAVRQLPKEAR